MKVREFIKQEIDIDVLDDVTEELNIAFVGPLELTAEGEIEFAEVLDLDIKFDGTVAIINVDAPGDAWKPRLRAAKYFFWSAAGYCADEDWHTWFIEPED